ncbi:MAG: choice-of-anchor tandem repeat GloVer-containing protein [Terriglobales bacterium]
MRSSALMLAVLLLVAVHPAQAQTETVLYEFCSHSNCSDGSEPYSRLTSDGAGNFYGTTEIGGLGYGTVFELSPNGSGGWNETVLHTFTGFSDGAYPFFTTLIFDSRGNLYGTTSDGGQNNYGVVFELSPVGQEWVETVLFNFGADGGPYGTSPFNGVVMDAAGNLYGTFLVEGFTLNEAVYELSPSSTGWTLTTIYAYDSPADDQGGGGLTMDAKGNIFVDFSAAYRAPAIVELSPDGNGGWNPTVLHTFQKYYYPTGPPRLDKAGNLYGTTFGGGADDGGTVYELFPGKNGEWKLKILYHFRNDTTDGSGPFAGVVFDAAGNLYGTTTFGGPSNLGTVFELARVGDYRYQEKVLWSFDGPDGNGPIGGLILDGAGNLYGMTPSGGNPGCDANAGCGVVFEVTP